MTDDTLSAHRIRRPNVPAKLTVPVEGTDVVVIGVGRGESLGTPNPLPYTLSFVIGDGSMTRCTLGNTVEPSSIVANGILSYKATICSGTLPPETNMLTLSSTNLIGGTTICIDSIILSRSLQTTAPGTSSFPLTTASTSFRSPYDAPSQSATPTSRVALLTEFITSIVITSSSVSTTQPCAPNASGSTATTTPHKSFTSTAQADVTNMGQSSPVPIRTQSPAPPSVGAEDARNHNNAAIIGGTLGGVVVLLPALLLRTRLQRLWASVVRGRPSRLEGHEDDSSFGSDGHSEVELKTWSPEMMLMQSCPRLDADTNMPGAKFVSSSTDADGFKTSRTSSYDMLRPSARTNEAAYGEDKHQTWDLPPGVGGATRCSELLASASSAKEYYAL